MPSTFAIKHDQVTAILGRSEGHFVDMKAREIKPAKLTKTLSGFANADGGELFVGIRELSNGTFDWKGFEKEEDANGHIQCLEQFFPLGVDFAYEFLASDAAPGLVLRVSVLKTRDVRLANDGIAYVRRGAQSLPMDSADKLLRLKRAKGISSFEDELLRNVGSDELADAPPFVEFLRDVVPQADPLQWLKKQRLVVDDAPTVAGVLLFSDEPQVVMPKAAAKIYRYKTADREGTRETLAFDPITVEGNIYNLVRDVVEKTVEIAEGIQIMTDEGLKGITYPRESLHEIITNAILHRDYAYNDDVHVRVFDNRVEIESPGRLPAHITPQNILDERFARNPKIVRLINKFPNPPNKDVGEGLNTAFRAMKKLRLRDPQIEEKENSVLVVIRHEQLASPEQQIMEFVRAGDSINNSQARQVTGIESPIKVRAVLQKLVRAGELELAPGTSRATTAYRIPERKR